jgi:ubiquinone/menaquinone biosynthesis C-methylase UbiE
VAEFCEGYDALRLREGWASEVAGYYEGLPFRDASGRHPEAWRSRASSFRHTQRWLIGAGRLRILELGAGSGWMSRELSARHDVLATDINAGPHGLGALPEAGRRFLAVQAESEQLPLADRAFDLVVANASLHHVTDVPQLFSGLARILRPGGRMIVTDSPVFPTVDAARAAQARTHAYLECMGAPELAHRYRALTDACFRDRTDFRFRRRRRYFALSWMARDCLRALLGRPVPARFALWIGDRLPDRASTPRGQKPLVSGR